MGYCVVLTAYNEGNNIQQVLNHLVAQTVKPDLVVVVDDNSTDKTFEEAFRYTWFTEFPYKVLKLEYPKSRLGYVNRRRAFMYGVAQVFDLCPEWGFLLKLDSDHLLPENYTQIMLDLFKSFPKVGTVSGTNNLEWRGIARNGAIMYRRQMYEDLDGIQEIPGWDSHIIYDSMSRGWGSLCVYVDGLQSIRPERDRSLSTWFSFGQVRYLQGFPLAHTLLTCITRIREKPMLLGVLAFLWGHLSMLLMLKPKPFSTDFYSFIKGYCREDSERKINSILGGI